jgi:DNA gyrase/topoisomerase IV subunit A
MITSAARNGMEELGVRPDSPHRKSARIVGEALE